MDTKKIKWLMQAFEKSNLTAMEVCEGESKVRLERAAATVAAAPVPLMTAAAPVDNLFQEESGAVDFNRLTDIKSPMVGVFYSAPAPDAVPFVKRGDYVKKGDVLCVIEAMKLMNEITAETDGEIADICVQNGEVVEFGQPLFKLF
jgi:acetyl-CoA carboxylase, biotin carboxyl carrier protein